MVGSTHAVTDIRKKGMSPISLYFIVSSNIH